MAGENGSSEHEIVFSEKEWLDERVPSEAKKLGLRHFINEVFKRLEGIENFDMESWCQEHARDWED